MRLSLCLLACLLRLTPATWAEAAEGRLLEARLLTDTLVAAPGSQVRLGVALAPAPGWHVYWKNPGQAGLPTRLTWGLPEGMGAEPAQWPLPDRFVEPGDVVVFAYDRPTLVTRTVTIPEDARPGDSLAIDVAARWLVCKEACVPGSAQLSGKVLVRDREVRGAAAPFEAAALQVPVPAERLTGTERPGGRFEVVVPVAEDTEVSQVFPDPGHSEAWLEVGATQRIAEGLRVELKGAPPPAGVTSEGPALVVSAGAADGTRRAVRYPLTLGW